MIVPVSGDGIIYGNVTVVTNGVVMPRQPTRKSGAYTRAEIQKRYRQRQQVWKFGLNPDDVAELVHGYGWDLVEQTGPDYYLQNYVEPTGRDLAASQLVWAAYCVKP